LTTIIIAVILYLLILFFLCRWAYKRNGTSGVLIVIFAGIIFGAIIVGLLPPDKDKDKK